MTPLLENDIERWAIETLVEQGWTHVPGAELLPGLPHAERERLQDVVLKHRLRRAVQRLNLGITPRALDEVESAVTRIVPTDLLAANEEFHHKLTDGVKVEVSAGGETRGEIYKLVDFDNPLGNDLLVVSQFEIKEERALRRPDLILFVNGLPLVVIELKRANSEQSTMQGAWNQLQTYKAEIPSLFVYNTLLVISDGLEARSGSLTAGLSRFMSWKTADGQTEASAMVPALETLIRGQLGPGVMLDLARYFTVFEKEKETDLKTGTVSIRTVKKVAAYHQYYAVNKAVERTREAAGERGNRKGGVVWHTQGSGKSLSMVFYTGKLIQVLDNPTVVVITDRNDLDDQLFNTFAGSRHLLRQDPVQAESRSDLKDLLAVASGGVVFTTIQKFSPEEGNVYEALTERRNVVVIADEAHRTQYGFAAKPVDEKDEEGNVIGSDFRYGFAKYLRDALPNATYLGFTGTPIESDDVNTAAVFGDYVDIYDIAQAVEDGATVRIFYESRLAKIALSEEGEKLVNELEDELQGQNLDDSQRAKAKWTQLEALVGAQNRLSNVAADIVQHFETRNEILDGKAMIVTMSRRIAVALYNEIVALRPEWHDDDLAAGAIKVVMTASAADGPDLAQHHTTKDQKRGLADRMRNPDDPLKLCIVRDMWLTGFDAPCLHTIYIDKPMKGHNLMQAIARVNRVYKDKTGGLVVDYLGIASDLKKALAFYSDSGGKGDPAAAQEQAVALMQEKLEVVSQMFREKPAQALCPELRNLAADRSVTYVTASEQFDYTPYYAADTAVKLRMILAGCEYILSLEDGKKRFMREFQALKKAYAIALPHEATLAVKEEVGFFEAVKSRFAKFEPKRSSGVSNAQLETNIRQVIDQALVSEQVVDVFDAAGLKKPEISILSDDFLMELKGMEYKNVALETLRKLLDDEISTRSRSNVVQSRTFREMLEGSIRRYQNKVLTAAEVIGEMIALAQEIRAASSRGEELGLTEYELAFYDAVAENESARELMTKDTLRKLSMALLASVRENASLDWTIREDVKARMRVAVKRLLKRYGYPPDLQLLAVDRVIEQAELLAELNLSE
jgi:type I restriction enzyme R subunit